MLVTVLGRYSPYAPVGGACPGLLVQARGVALMLDGGPGTVGMAVKNLPSALYWGGMRTHGILKDPTLSRDDTIAAEVDRVRTRRPVAVQSEDEAASPWHDAGSIPPCPLRPTNFRRRCPTGSR